MSNDGLGGSMMYICVICGFKKVSWPKAKAPYTDLLEMVIIVVMIMMIIRGSGI